MIYRILELYMECGDVIISTIALQRHVVGIKCIVIARDYI